MKILYSIYAISTVNCHGRGKIKFFCVKASFFRIFCTLIKIGRRYKCIMECFQPINLVVV